MAYFGVRIKKEILACYNEGVTEESLTLFEGMGRGTGGRKLSRIFGGVEKLILL